jgi:hypothetical protein
MINSHLISWLQTINRRPISWVRVMAVALPLATVLIYLVWLFGGRYADKLQVRLNQDPISSIQSIRITPGDNFSLVSHDVVITNASTIYAIMTSIRSAETYFPNHPTTRWSCYLTVLSSSGTSYVTVVESYGQGTILFCTTSQSGLIFDTLQSKTLGQILEQAVSQSALTTHSR